MEKLWFHLIEIEFSLSLYLYIFLERQVSKSGSVLRSFPILFIYYGFFSFHYYFFIYYCYVSELCVVYVG